MKRWSIKLKLTCLYGGFMILLIVAALAILFSLSTQEVLSSVQSDLKEQVQGSVEELEEEDGKLEVDSDFYTMENGVYLSVYSVDGDFLYGRIPAGFGGQPDFEHDILRTVREGQETFYVFDMEQRIQGYGSVYIRGITSVTRAENSFTVTLRFALILLPGLAVVMILLSYFFVRRALLPVRRITDTVKEIREEEDLSRRVDLPDGKDEIYHLADTFDQLLAELQEAFARERQFTSDVSHELRTPAAVILLQSEELLADPSLSEEQKEQLEAIRRKARDMSSMISQLLLLSRADQGRQALQKELLDISELTQMTAEEQQLLAQERHISIETDIEPGIVMEADESFFIRLLVNLISNSISYGREGGTTKVSLRREGKMAVLAVADNGQGIEEKDLPRIWDRFYRADASRSDAGHSGLGLSIVKWIALEHGGEVAVESEKGKGSVFTCRFPL
ncbi:HAMP domain-containing protein [Faecalicatena fissicatena]|uniref:histidine kinase n=2 Tax=Faecalicatena fissicatena TaxID=290055 RepID=A0ABS2E9N9_9FIRM|nr:ATP-binding protein [Faecalicatena fissicatena]MBM6738361.1 HAMP domain-containing protein [Faecalicatena fissicatena]HIX98100.1 HAMP domain-containing protein [Candidatus Dorea intestinigallinarum]